jgi:thiol-disulfide isomerase/thioredoxin
MQKLVSGLAVVTAAAIMLVLAPLAGAVMPSFSQELGGEAAQQQAPSLGEEGKAVDFTLKDLGGKAVKLSQFRGHPVVVDFWATWCEPCREQIPELKRLYDEYHKTTGLVIVGVACDTVQGEGAKVVPPFVKELAIDYPILLANDDVLEQFDVIALPTTVFILPSGKIAGRLRGAGPKEELSAAVRQLLMQSGQKPAVPGKPENPKKGTGQGNWVNLSYTP